MEPLPNAHAGGAIRKEAAWQGAVRRCFGPSPAPGVACLCPGALGELAREAPKQFVGGGDLRIVVPHHRHVLEHALIIFVGAQPVADIDAVDDLVEKSHAGGDGGFALVRAGIAWKLIHHAADVQVFLRESPLGDGAENVFDFGELGIGVEVRGDAHGHLVVVGERAEQKAESPRLVLKVVNGLQDACGACGVVGVGLA